MIYIVVCGITIEAGSKEEAEEKVYNEIPKTVDLFIDYVEEAL